MFKLCGFVRFYQICRKIPDGHFFNFRILDAFFSGTDLYYSVTCIWNPSGANSQPTEEDILLKSKRQPLNGPERKALVQQFFVPVVCIIFLYISLTVLRDFRDNFNREIWDGLHFHFDSSIFTLTEIPIAIMVLVILSFMVKVKNNKKLLHIIITSFLAEFWWWDFQPICFSRDRCHLLYG